MACCCCQWRRRYQCHSWYWVSGYLPCLNDQGHLHHFHCQSLNLSPSFSWGFPHTLNPHCGFHFGSWPWLGYAGTDPDRACHRPLRPWNHGGGHYQQMSGNLCRSFHSFFPDWHQRGQQQLCTCPGNHGHAHRIPPLVHDWLCCLWWGLHGGGRHHLLSQRSGPCPSWRRTLKILKWCPHLWALYQTRPHLHQRIVLFHHSWVWLSGLTHL